MNILDVQASQAGETPGGRLQIEESKKSFDHGGAAGGTEEFGKNACRQL